MDDQKADFAYFFLEDPTINEGRLGDPTFFRNQFQNLGAEAGTSAQIQEALISGTHLSANTALGTNGCPIFLANKRGVFIFTDSQGSVAVSLDGGDSNSWDLDLAAVNSPTLSPAFAALGLEGRVLTKTRELDPTLVSIHIADPAIVRIAWDAPHVWTDAPTDPLTGTYSVFSVTVPRGTDPTTGPVVEMADSDGNNTDTMATLAFVAPDPDLDTSLLVRFDIASSGGRFIQSGLSAPLRFDPTLATPGKGKKLGHDRAPGQNR